jgi:putative heme iron utilization protein
MVKSKNNTETAVVDKKTEGSQTDKHGWFDQHGQVCFATGSKSAK